MKRILVAIVFGMVMASCAGIDPGYAGVQVNYYGTGKGVSVSALKTGRYPYNPLSTDIISYPTFTQTAKYEGPEKLTFNDKDSLVITAAISFSYQLAEAKAPVFYEKFRIEDMNTFTHGQMHNTVRDMFNEVGSKLRAEDIIGSQKEAFLHAVRDRVNAETEAYGIAVEQFGVIGAMEPPAAVTDAITQKITATQNAQRVENELRQSTANAAKVVADAKGQAEAAIEKARGQAEANRLIVNSVTPQLLEWRRLTIQEQATQKWNGTLPSMMLGNGATPLLNINPPK